MSYFSQLDKISEILMKGLNKQQKKSECVREVVALNNEASRRFAKAFTSAKDKAAKLEVYYQFAVPSNDWSKSLDSRYCKRKDRKAGWWD